MRVSDKTVIGVKLLDVITINSHIYTTITLLQRLRVNSRSAELVKKISVATKLLDDIKEMILVE